MAEQLSSGITVTEEDPQVRNIAGAQTSILMALGITQRGPFEATLVTSFKEFKKVYGNHTTDGYLSQCVQGFFDEGGQAAYIKRVVHYTDIADDSTDTADVATENLESEAASPSAGSVTGSIVGPFALVDGDTIIVNVDASGNDTATFNAAAAQRTGAATAPYTLANNQTLLVAIDGGSVQTIAFLTAEFADITNATAAEVAAVIAAKIVGAQCSVSGGAPRITSDRKGTGSSVNVSGGTSNAELGFTTGATSGTGDASNAAFVTVAEIKTLVEGDIAGLTVSDSGGAVKITSNTTGGSSSILVAATSTADDELGFDNATHSGSSGAAVDCVQVDGKTKGTYGNLVEITIEDATNGDADDFNLTVSYDGAVVSSWPDLSVDSTSTRFCETIVNNASSGDDYVAITTLVDSTRPANQSITLVGGTDGLSSISDTDFVGSAAARTGLHGFNTLDEGELLICPDRATAAVHVAAVNYCAVTKKGRVFPVLDTPSGLSVAAVRTYFKTTAGLKNLSEFGAFYYPRVKVLNPNKTVFGTAATVTIPNSGHIAGVYAATDAARSGGVYDAPAGTEKGRFRSVVGLESDYTLEEANRNLLYPDRINPLNIQGGAIFIDGVRTLKGNGNFPSVSERRGVIFIETSVKDGIEFSRYKNIDDTLLAAVNRTVDAFLNAQTRLGAFRSRKPAEAYYVDTSKKYNPISLRLQNKFIVKIGLATQKPGEFIELLVSQDTRDLEAELS